MGYKRSCGCSKCRDKDRVESIVHPTRHVVKERTNHRTVRNIHPTQVQNVNRTIVRNENYYPVEESNVEETVVENYDCGCDVNDSSNCRRVGGQSTGNDCNKHSKGYGRSCGCKRGWF